jgi:cytochrome P450
MLYIVGGTETVAVAMQWYPKFMTNHPEVQHKLRAHLLERIPELQDREMTYDDVAGDNLPYLEAVVHDCLRMARVAPALAREGE